MAELTISPDDVRILATKASAAIANVPSDADEDPDRELEIDAATAISSDDHDHLAEEDEPDHSIDEVRAYIDGLEDEQKAEVVALVWVGRGDFEPRDFADAVREASAIRDSVGDYLLGMPLFPSYLESGLDAIVDD